MRKALSTHNFAGAHVMQLGVTPLRLHCQVGYSPVSLYTVTVIQGHAPVQ